MRARLVDIVLIVLLIVVAFGITWTLLTLNQGDTRRGESRAEQPQEQAGQPAGDSGIEILPIPTNGQQNGGEQPAAPSQEDEGAQPQGDGDEPQAQEQEPEDTQPTTEDPGPLPAGRIQLERVGFSYATGAAGACGFELEPWEHVAVSRDMLAAYGCGATVNIRLADEVNGLTEFDAVIGDTMNPVHSRTVNVYVGEDEPALQYGVTSGSLEALEGASGE